MIECSRSLRPCLVDGAMTPRSRPRWLVAALIGAASCVFGCSGQEVIIKTASGEEITAKQIDAAPLSLLPASALGIARLDAPVAFQSHLGQSILSLARSRAPLPESAGFDPQRDLHLLVVGFYAMAGVDFVGVAVGNFDGQRITSAADGVALTPLGAPLVKTEYAGRTLFTTANIGFVVLTDHTALFGDETGMRRALDRLEVGVFRDETPQATRDLFATPGATLSATFQVAGDPTVASAASSFPFLGQIEAARLLGNFQAPGLNLAGTLTYATPEASQAASGSVTQLGTLVSAAGLLTSIFGMGQPLTKLEARPNGRQLDVAVSADGQTAGKLLNQVAGALGAGAVWGGG